MTKHARVSCHFGEWLQGRLGSDGPVVLITLACPSLEVRATREPKGAFFINGNSGLSHGVAARFFAALKVALPMGRFDVVSDVDPGSGVGVSTASLLVLAAAAGIKASAEELATAALVAEGAVDPLMMPGPDQILWASRSARVVRPVAALPEFDVVGGFWGAPERTNAADDGFPNVADLVAEWDTSKGDASALACIASASADRTTALRGPFGDPTSGLAVAQGALGHARAHTGSARTLLFPVDGIPANAESAMRDAGYSGVFRFRTGGP